MFNVALNWAADSQTLDVGEFRRIVQKKYDFDQKAAKQNVYVCLLFSTEGKTNVKKSNSALNLSAFCLCGAEQCNTSASR